MTPSFRQGGTRTSARLTRRACHFGRLGLILGTVAPQHEQLAQVLDRLAGQTGADFAQVALARFALGRGYSHLDECVRGQGEIDFVQHSRGEPGLTNGDHRVEVMGRGPQGAAGRAGEVGGQAHDEDVRERTCIYCPTKDNLTMLNPTGKRHRSNKDWLTEHVNDAFVQKAKKEGYRSRAAYKLLEIDAKDRLLRPGSVIVDLGAAPGSWSQVALRRTGGQARIIAIDLLPMQGLNHVEFIQGDFSEDSVLTEIERRLDGQKVDLVMSDMLPNMTGVPAIDSPRAIHLGELAADFAIRHLKPTGKFLTKAYQGPGYDEFFKGLKVHFEKVVSRKPEASRNRSAEIFLLASGLRLADP